jgi:NAD(P)-dependent dehydrogenase (short-subunit alcohol dehydrogenase family)
MMAGVAVVTGANKGIGFHIAKQLLESGRFRKVLVACRDPVTIPYHIIVIVVYHRLTAISPLALTPTNNTRKYMSRSVDWRPCRS